MNARSRSHAILGLENLSFIICVHLVLVETFPENSAASHWKGELNGFLKTLRRYNKATGKRKSNYTRELLELSLHEILEDSALLEDIEDFIASKGLAIDSLDIDGAKKIATRFADNVLGQGEF